MGSAISGAGQQVQDHGQPWLDGHVQCRRCKEDGEWAGRRGGLEEEEEDEEDVDEGQREERVDCRALLFRGNTMPEAEAGSREEISTYSARDCSLGMVLGMSRSCWWWWWWLLGHGWFWSYNRRTLARL